MATAGKDLSEIDLSGVPRGGNFKVGIVVSEWNHNITSNLLEGAKEVLLAHGIAQENIVVEWTPGSFELAQGAKWLIEHAGCEGVVALGSVIQGETRHFDFVCHGVTQGIMDVSLQTDRPVIFGVLTDNHMDQAIARSGGVHGNKGSECAAAVLKMIHLRSRLSGH